MSRWTMPLVAALGVLLGMFGMMWFDALGTGGVSPGDRRAVERTVRDYLLAHPEVIPEAMQRLQDREQSRLVAANRAVTRPFAGAWTGSAQADVSVVEFYDYNCGYCRASLPTLKALRQADPKLRIVYRELPILAPSSRAAARMSLAAAAQGRFAQFHDALYAGGHVTDQTIAAAARTAGVDTAAAAAFVPKADAEIARNLETAGKLGLTGTPSWVIGDRVLSGALPLEELQKAVAAARGR